MKRFLLIFECTVVLLLCASGASLSHLWKSGPLTAQIAGVGLIIPAISAMMFLFVSEAVPSLYAVGRLRFPLNFTLPIIYGAMLILTMALMSRVGLSIARVPDALAAINIWSNRWLLVTTVIAGVICLSVLGVLDRERTER